MFILILLLLYLLYAPLPSLYFKLFKRPREKRLLLSFDDGPSEITNALLTLLEKHDEKALFFLLAVEAEKNPFLIRRILEKGHDIGLHGSTHRSHLFLNPYASYKEIKDAYAYLSCFGEIRYARLPYGKVNLASLFTMKKLKLKHKGWDHLLGDWKDLPQGVLRKKLGSLKRGLVVLHDGTAGSAHPHAKKRMLHELSAYLLEKENEKEISTALSPWYP